MDCSTMSSNVISKVITHEDHGPTVSLDEEWTDCLEEKDNELVREFQVRIRELLEKVLALI